MIAPWAEPEVVRVEFPELVEFGDIGDFSELKNTMQDSISAIELIMKKSIEEINISYKDTI